jgi:hypothetical protein
MVRGTARDEVNVSVAIPIVQHHAVRGAIRLSTKVSGWWGHKDRSRAQRRFGR